MRAAGEREAEGQQAHREASYKDRKSTRLNSSHDQISYAVFCLKKKKNASWPRSRRSTARANWYKPPGLMLSSTSRNLKALSDARSFALYSLVIAARRSCSGPR